MSQARKFLRLLVPTAVCSFFLFNAVRRPDQRTLSLVFAAFAVIWLIGLFFAMRPKPSPFPIERGK